MKNKKIEKESVIETKEQTIHEKYEKYINQVKDGYIKGLPYSDAIEILRFCEKKIGKDIPMNTNCASCMIDLIKLFINLK